MFQVRRRVRPSSYLMIFFVVGAMIAIAHVPLLQLPYYWDEAGQFIPAASDIYQAGQFIPHSATPNVHPPAVMAWIALAWQCFGDSIPVTRSAMLLLASFGALMTFLLAIELSRGSPGTPAFTALALLCISPLFYAQSILAQLDMPAMGFTALALLLFLQNRFRACAMACVALVMVKETGIVLPLVFTAWLIYEKRFENREDDRKAVLWFLLPAAALTGWLAILKHFTGHWFGNTGFTDYNLTFQLNPVRLLFALFRRAYYLFIGSGHFIGTAVFLYAWKRMPLLRDRPWRIAATVMAAHIIAVSAFGGAVLERYLLPVLPILYSAFAVALRALNLKPARIAIAALAVCLVLANFINPPYPFPFENNLMFVKFTDIAREAAFAVDTYNTPVTTTFPMSAVLEHPHNGYIAVPHEVHEVPDFHFDTMQELTKHPPPLMLVYNTETDPWHIRSTRPFRWFFGRFYNYERQMTPYEVAQSFGMRIARVWESDGFTMALLVDDEANGPALLR